MLFELLSDDEDDQTSEDVGFFWISGGSCGLDWRISFTHGGDSGGTTRGGFERVRTALELPCIEPTTKRERNQRLGQ